MEIFCLQETLDALPKGKRDSNPEFDCEAFTTESVVLQSPDCSGDGHYMCPRCKRFDKNGEEE